jgi:hypothetical protein
MEIDLYKEAAYLASNFGNKHWWQCRSWYDVTREMWIEETPDLPGCRVEMTDYAFDSYEELHERGKGKHPQDILDRAHYEKRLEIIYGYLERGEPLPEIIQQVKNEEAIARAKEQSPHYFVVRVEWRGHGHVDEDGDVNDGEGYWLATSDVGTQHIYDAESEIGRVMAMIGDNLWITLDSLMESGYWPPLREADVVVKDGDGNVLAQHFIRYFKADDER